MKSDCFLHWVTQLRVWHWETRNHACHLAMGSAYEAFTEMIDRYVEVYQGRNDRLPLPTFDYCPEYSPVKETSGKIRWFRQYLLIDLTQDLDKTTDSDLLNLRDEMLAELNKLSYLLTLT